LPRFLEGIIRRGERPLMLWLVVPIAVLAWFAAALFVMSLCAMAARASGVEPEELADLERELPPLPLNAPSIEDLMAPGGLVLGGPRRFG
jgi:hypothetical protein